MSNQTLREVRRHALAAGFYAAGESLSVDLVDTIKLVASPVCDLLDGREESFWRTHRAQLPEIDALPDAAATRELRAALRHLFEAAIDGVAPAMEAVNYLNKVARSSIPIAQLDGPNVLVGDGDPLLAAVARSAIATLGTPSELRRCSSPRCSMLYVSDSESRLWCSQTCGNRIRVQRSVSSVR